MKDGDGGGDQFVHAYMDTYFRGLKGNSIAIKNR